MNKYEEIKALSDKGGLPAFAREKPLLANKFEARIANTRIWTVSAWLFSIFTILCVFIVQKKLGQGSTIADSWGFILMALFCLIVALASITGKYLYISRPVALESFENGIWLGWEKIFIPYERLIALDLVKMKSRLSQDSAPMPELHLVVFMKEEEKKTVLKNDIASILRRPFSDRGRFDFIVSNSLNISYDEILEKTGEIATEYNKRHMLLPPEIKTRFIYYIGGSHGC